MLDEVGLSLTLFQFQYVIQHCWPNNILAMFEQALKMVYSTIA